MTEDSYAPKYVQIVETLRRRIADGIYPIGAQLPSEAQLMKEFGVSRPTVVRAMQEMALLGEIEREHGRGSFVKLSNRRSVEAHTRPGLAVLDRQEAEGVIRVVTGGVQPAPPHIAPRLEVADSARIHLRRYVRMADSLPSELVSLWTSVEVAKSAGLEGPLPLTVPIRRLLTAATSERLARLTETLSARMPEDFEAPLLGITVREPVLAMVGTVIDASDRPVMVVEVVLPGTLHDLEDSYSL